MTLQSTQAQLKDGSAELDRLMDLTVHLLDRCPSTADLKGMSGKSAVIIVGLTNKLLHCARCVQVLSVTGFADEAQIHLRVMIETMAHMHFLARPTVRVPGRPRRPRLSSDFRGKLFAAASALSLMRVHADVRELSGWRRSISREHTRKLAAMRQALAQEIGTEWDKRLWTKRNCGGVTITQYLRAVLPPKLRAGVVGVLYARTSRIVHAYDMENYLDKDDESGGWKLLGPNTGPGDEVLRTAGVLLLMGCDLLNNRFRLGSPRVEAERKRLQSLVESRRQAQARRPKRR